MLSYKKVVEKPVILKITKSNDYKGKKILKFNNVAEAMQYATQLELIFGNIRYDITK